jgi:hypothetical protein
MILILFLLSIVSYCIWPESLPSDHDINKNETSGPLGKNMSSFVWKNHQNVDWVSSAELLELHNIPDNCTYENQSLTYLRENVTKNETSGFPGKNIRSFVWENYQNVDWVSSAELLEAGLLELHNIPDNCTYENQSLTYLRENVTNLTR